MYRSWLEYVEKDCWRRSDGNYREKFAKETLLDWERYQESGANVGCRDMTQIDELTIMAKMYVNIVLGYNLVILKLQTILPTLATPR